MAYSLKFRHAVLWKLQSDHKRTPGAVSALALMADFLPAVPKQENFRSQFPGIFLLFFLGE